MLLRGIQLFLFALFTVIRWSWVSILLLFTYTGIGKFRKKKVEWKKILFLFLALEYILGVLFVVGLLGRPNSLAEIQSSEWYFNYHLELLKVDMLMDNFLNVILFIPMGIFYAIYAKSACLRNAFLIGFSISLAIELLQTIFGRCGDVNDLCMNTVGMLLGYLLLRLYLKKKSNGNTDHQKKAVA